MENEGMRDRIQMDQNNEGIHREGAGAQQERPSALTACVKVFKWAEMMTLQSKLLVFFER